VVTKKREGGVVAGAAGGVTKREHGEGKTEFVTNPSQIGFSIHGAKRGKNLSTDLSALLRRVNLP